MTLRSFTFSAFVLLNSIVLAEESDSIFSSSTIKSGDPLPVTPMKPNVRSPNSSKDVSATIVFATSYSARLADNVKALNKNVRPTWGRDPATGYQCSSKEISDDLRDRIDFLRVAVANLKPDSHLRICAMAAISEGETVLASFYRVPKERLLLEQK